VLITKEYDRLWGYSCVPDDRQLNVQQETTVTKNNTFVSIFPNLVSDQMRLRLVAPEEESMRCEVFDVQGRLAFAFFAEVQSGAHDYDFPPEIASLAPGLYFATITLGDATFTHRFVKTNTQ
jgi:hypothetical protein